MDMPVSTLRMQHVNPFKLTGQSLFVISSFSTLPEESVIEGLWRKCCPKFGHLFPLTVFEHAGTRCLVVVPSGTRKRERHNFLEALQDA